MPKTLKKQEFVRCPVCHYLFSLKIGITRVPKHGTPHESSTTCPGSGKPIKSEYITRRYH